MRNQVSVRAVARSAVAAAILVVVFFSALLWTHSPFGMSIAPWLVSLSALAIVCGCVVAICTVFVALILIFLRLVVRHPLRKAPQAAISAAVFLLVSWFLARGLVSIFSRVNPATVTRVAERSAPLVDAIRRFEAARGKPPAVLAELVPEFLPSIPGAGIRLAPEYEYTVGSEAYCENPWMLSYSHPVVPYSLDSGGAQYYLPRGNYEDEKCVLPGKIVTIEAGWEVVGF